MKVACKFILLLFLLMPFSCVSAIGSGDDEEVQIKPEEETIHEIGQKFDENVKTSYQNKQLIIDQSDFNHLKFTKYIDSLKNKIKEMQAKAVNKVKRTVIKINNIIKGIDIDYSKIFENIFNIFSQIDIDKFILIEKSKQVFDQIIQKSLRVTVENIDVVKEFIIRSTSLERQRRDIVRIMTMF